MNSFAALVLVAASFTAAYADDPTIDASAPEEPPAASEPAPVVDEGPVTSPTETPAAPEPKVVPPRRARMMDPSPRSMTPRVRDDGQSRLDKTEDEVAGGRHWRIKTAQGAVHVWVPPGYDRATAGTVFYVHGYWTDADGAWREHQLARQFKASRQNAMFVVPDAPSSNEERVQWPALTDLRKAVTRANIKLPDGPVVVMGHSGAFRTIMQWVDHRAVDKIILLDAMYAGEAAFDQFIGSGKRAEHHRLIVVASNTAAGSRSFAKRYKFAVTRDRLPDSANGFSRRERSAKLLYVRSQYEHMAIVTSKKVIPMLLRVTSLKSL
ncbi:MAG TPA: hypothetical protein VM513_23280 [Kofleriaceae bacterium]|jgi:hypothetical protein|nr:hypothetical protein [Kofleriaceae bacterium]